MNEPKDPEAAETAQTESIKAVDPAAICSRDDHRTDSMMPIMCRKCGCVMMSDRAARLQVSGEGGRGR